MAVLPFLIVLTGSRGGFIGLAVFVVLAFRKQLLRVKKFLAIAVVGAAIVIIVPNNLWHRIGTISEVDEASARSEVEYESSTAQRLEIWKVATTVILEHPVIGVGLGAYPEVHFRYAQRPQFDPTAYGHRDAHSTYLLIAAELGLVGLFIFAAIVVVTLRDAERARRAAARAQPRLAMQLFYMEMGFVAYLVAGIWASWGTLVFTYLHLAILNVTARLLLAELGTAPGRTVRGALTARRGPRTAAVGMRRA
jgi:O-antigen ligase